MSSTEFADRLLAWYAEQARDLPWRRTRDPYAIWVAEIMLQQTQVEAVKPYYERFLIRFPTVEALAAAPLDDALKLWEGLGYYARARNLHTAAQRIVAEHGGQVPSDPKALSRLPGIGRYTAGAILSIAFGQDTPVLDGNVRRVLCRVFHIAEDPRQPAVERRLWELAASLVPRGQGGSYNQALMDLGATICTPRAPRCLICPLMALCEARKRGDQERLPVKAPRRELPHYDVTAGVVWRDGRVLLAQRPPDRLLGGLWVFPGGKREAGETLEECLRREIREELGIEIEVGPQLMTLAHAYTHFRITLHVFACRHVSGEAQALDVAACRWVAPDELSSYAMAVTDQQIARRVMTRGEGSAAFA
jgi:A/G-specific adenine glycosylase